jgi:mannosyltransferase
VIPERHRLAIGGLTALAVVLRFSTLDSQSFWADEVATVKLLDLDLPSMLRAIPDSEGTPPVYYVLAWGWTQLFGTGEIGVRSLSALAGAAAVPVFYAAAAELCSRRVALAVAALAAVNPLLIWYSQEARSYSLVVLLGALSVWAFARMLRRPSPGLAAVWMLASALALGTHYFAGFLVAAEAAWLLAAQRTRRQAAPAVAGLAIVVMALIPLVTQQEQLGVGSWISATGSLPYRAGRAVKQSVLGYDLPLETAATLVGAGLVAAGLVLALRLRDEDGKRGVRIAGVLGGGAAGVPLVLAIAGHDYFDVRNLIAAWLPLAIVVTGGLLSKRAGGLGIAAVAALVLIEATATIGVALEPGWQREDWRGAATALGTSGDPRAVMVQPHFGQEPLQLYLPGTGVMPPAGAFVREVVFVTTVVRTGDDVHPDPPPRAPAPVVPGFHLVEARYGESYTLIRLRRGSPRKVSARELSRHRLSQNAEAAVLLVPPSELPETPRLP